MSGFSKLWSDIVTSSIWCRDDKTLRVWIAMLALSNAQGFVGGSIPGLASLCRMSIEEMQAALLELSSPDPFSRTKIKEGRRIEEADGGWTIINYEKHRGRRDPEERRKQVREATARYRGKKTKPSPVIQCDPNVSRGEPSRAQAEAEAEAVKKDSGEVIPAPLETGEFIEAWKDWHDYRKEARLKAWTPRTRKSKLQELARLGSEKASAAIRYSIANGWQGIFAEKEKGKGSGLAPSSDELAYLHAGGPRAWGL